MRVNTQGWLPYLATYASFLIIVQIKGFAPESLRPWFLLPQVLVPGGLLLYFLGRRAYPELRNIRFTLHGALADVVVGLAIGLLWMAPYMLGWLGHPPAEEGFDPTDLAGDRFRGLSLLVRFTGFVLVTPFIEELFVRSALFRYVAGYRTRTDFRRMPMARFEWLGFLVTVLFFTFSHASWEWPVAFACGIIFNLWLYYRGNIGATILAHAAANAVIYVLVVFPDVVGPGRDLDLRFFL